MGLWSWVYNNNYYDLIIHWIESLAVLLALIRQLQSAVVHWLYAFINFDNLQKMSLLFRSFWHRQFWSNTTVLLLTELEVFTKQTNHTYIIILNKIMYFYLLFFFCGGCKSTQSRVKEPLIEAMRRSQKKLSMPCMVVASHSLLLLPWGKWK